jgi:hypothetical protein
VIRNTVPGGRMVVEVEKSNRETVKAKPQTITAEPTVASSTKSDDFALPELNSSDDLNLDADFDKSFDDVSAAK